MLYLFLQFVLELNESVKEVVVDVFNALDRLIVYQALQIFLWNLLAQLLVSTNPIQSLALLQSRLIHILLLGQGEGEYVVQKALQKFVELFLLVRQQSLVQDVEHELFLKDYQRVKIFYLIKAVEENCPS